MAAHELARRLRGGTAVGFPAGQVEGESPVLWAGPDASGELTYVITGETPFHPLDHTWPDQPGDTGQLCIGGTVLPVVDSVTAAIGPDSDVPVFGPDITARRGTEGWGFLVAHVVAAASAPAPEDLVGQVATLSVDPGRRRALSAAHTACHVMALALNKHTARFWRKPVRPDSLGNPDLDQLTVAESRMTVHGSVDRYRLGKSARKSGLEVQALLGELPAVEQAVQDQLREWIDKGGDVRIDVPDDRLGSVRTWVCDLSDGTARLPCGGTHLSALAELGAVRVELRPAEDGSPEVVSTTTPAPVGGPDPGAMSRG